MKQQYMTPTVRELGSVASLTQNGLTKSGVYSDFQSTTLSPGNTVLGSWK
jgi:hypothetical protein